ncbi:hypothetical protein [Halocatena marina]|uniref:hypothetical protein n=1 Tax=Halocatena marina TaxID=2934937 RepID=UPI00200C30BE|nr:hypothetical protein [Halocatena marina]
MSALRAVLFEWDLVRVYRILAASLAVYVTANYTDDFLLGLGVVIIVGAVLDTPRWLYDRYARPSDE